MTLDIKYTSTLLIEYVLMKVLVLNENDSKSLELRRKSFNYSSVALSFFTLFQTKFTLHLFLIGRYTSKQTYINTEILNA